MNITRDIGITESSYPRLRVDTTVDTTKLVYVNDTTIAPQSPTIFLYVVYLGWALSITSLLITVATYLTLRSLRNKTTSRLLICLSLSLLCLYIIFAVGVPRKNFELSGGVCEVVAALVHYFTLTSVFWMSVESYAAYLWIVKGRKPRGVRFFVKSCLIAWGLPLLIICLIAAIDHTQYYRPYDSTLCFMVTPKLTGNWNVRDSWAFIFFNLVLIFIVLVCTFLFLSFVAKEIVFGRDFAPRYGDRDHEKKRKQAILRTVNDFVMSILLDMTWIFGTIFYVYPNNPNNVSRDGVGYAFFQLFCLCYFLQGFLVFLLFCVRLEEVRNLWTDWFYKVRSFIRYLREPLSVLLFIAVIYVTLDVMELGAIFD